MYLRGFNRSPTNLRENETGYGKTVLHYFREKRGVSRLGEIGGRLEGACKTTRDRGKSSLQKKKGTS